MSRVPRLILLFTAFWMVVEAETTQLDLPEVFNDPQVHRHVITLRDLEPDTAYVYLLGDGSDGGWSEPREFTTAPEEAEAFSFIYLGDAQNGLNQWGTLLHNTFRQRPDAAFYVVAGDLVNRGDERNEWDSFFHHAAGVFDRRPLMPALGNHDARGDTPILYLEQFMLPSNGPLGLESERAYSFEYGNAFFAVLDSNSPPEAQAVWLDRQLAETKAIWKFVVFHHPVYASTPGRDFPEDRESWVPIFDKHHVDMVFQGHDHAYLRTYPLKGHKRVDSSEEGTIYLISVSGTKMYEQQAHDYTEVGITNVSTYQVVEVDDRRLIYRAYDADGDLLDTVVLEK